MHRRRRGLVAHLRRASISLPSAAVLARTRESILAWWREAWCADPALAAVPVDGEAAPEAVFAGLEWRRLRVRQDQGAPEWAGS